MTEAFEYHQPRACFVGTMAFTISAVTEKEINGQEVDGTRQGKSTAGRK
jgi:hypothetical protein